MAELATRMTADRNQAPTPDGKGDLVAELEEFLVENTSPQVIEGFRKTEEKRKKAQEKEARLRKIKDFAEYYRPFITGVVVGSVIAGSGIYALHAYKESKDKQKAPHRAEAVMSVLQLPDAVRALDLSPNELSTAQQVVLAEASSSNGLTAEGYRDLSKLYAGALVTARALHNPEPPILGYVGDTSYGIWVDHPHHFETVIPVDILTVSPNVAVAVAKLYPMDPPITP